MASAETRKTNRFDAPIVPGRALDGQAEAYFEALMDGPFFRASARASEPGSGLRATGPRAAGPWLLDHMVGQGGTGIVYEAWNVDPEFARPAVVKVARPGLSFDAAARFRDEALTLRRFDHAAVVQGFGGGLLDDGRPFLAMERIWGTPVTAFAHDLSVRQRLEVFRDVCAAVAVVHRERVIHCDLKPGNVFVTDDGDVKLLDFGISQPLGDTDTAPGIPHLTPDFAAPEQLLGTPISLATDVYALGLVLHDVLCGRRRRVPWGLSGGGTTLFSGTLTRAVLDEPGSQTRLQPHDIDALCLNIQAVRLDWRIDEILCTALQADPALRYPTASELSVAIEGVLGSLAAPTPLSWPFSDEPGPSSPPPPP